MHLLTSQRADDYSAPSLFPAAPSTPKSRTWTDSANPFKMEAKLVKKTATDVMLRTDAGREIALPIAKYSEADRKHLKEMGPPSNPFAP